MDLGNELPSLHEAAGRLFHILHPRRPSSHAAKGVHACRRGLGATVQLKVHLGPHGRVHILLAVPVGECDARHLRLQLRAKPIRLASDCQPTSAVKWHGCIRQRQAYRLRSRDDVEPTLTRTLCYCIRQLLPLRQLSNATFLETLQLKRSIVCESLRCRTQGFAGYRRL